MKGRKFYNPAKELVFISTGVLLVIGVIFYAFFAIRSLSQKTKEAFGPPKNTGEGRVLFDFEKYDKLIPGLPEQENSDIDE